MKTKENQNKNQNKMKNKNQNKMKNLENFKKEVENKMREIQGLYDALSRDEQAKVGYVSILSVAKKIERGDDGFNIDANNIVGIFGERKMLRNAACVLERNKDYRRIADDSECVKRADSDPDGVVDSEEMEDLEDCLGGIIEMLEGIIGKKDN